MPTITHPEPPVVIEVSAEWIGWVQRATHGSIRNPGGFQRVLYELEAGLDEDVLIMTVASARRVLRYSASRYGAGTYQKILRAIAPAVRAALKAQGIPELEPVEPVLDL